MSPGDGQASAKAGDSHCESINNHSTSWWSYLFGVLLFCLAFVVVQRLTFLLRCPPLYRATIWTPGSLLLAALLLVPRRVWWQYVAAVPLAVIAAFYGDYAVPIHVAMIAVPFSAGAVVLAAWAIQQFGGTPVLGSQRSLMVLVIFGGIAVPVTANAPLMVREISGGLPDVWSTTLRAVLAGALGTVIATPALVLTLANSRKWLRLASRWRYVEVACLVLGVVVVGSFAFDRPAGKGTPPALLYAPLPLLVWAALRFEVAGVCWALLAVAIQASWGAIHGRGPFTTASPAENTLQIQFFVLAISAPLMFLASIVMEQRKAAREMLAEIAVRQRTEAAFRGSQRDLRAGVERIQDLAGRLITAQETERARIARELHDNLSQQLAALSISLSGLKRRLPAAADVHDELAGLQRLTVELADAIRGMSHDLHPSVLRHCGLVAAIQAHCAEFRRQHAIDMTVEMNEVEGLAPDVSLCIYRVAQEALQNVARHADARNVRVVLRRAAECVELMVVDDGRGFDPEEARRGGLGLTSLDERARLAGGRLSIASQPQWGTEVRVHIPLGVTSDGPRPNIVGG